MALTPEDVVNKRFNPTKFREGYDQDEVDDFLDEVVVELRRLNQENEELRQRLIAGESRINELQRAGAAAPAAAFPAPAPVAAPEPAFAAAPAPAPLDASAMDPGNTNNLLQLARRLHEEHVREGVEKRDALIAEGHAAAARVVQEAEQTQRGAMAQLEQERTGLERRVQELRDFEREYREKLKGYIQGQLQELESSQPVGASTPQPQASIGQQGGAAQPAPQAVAAGAAPASNGYVMPAAGDYAGYPPSQFPGFGGN